MPSVPGTAIVTWTPGARIVARKRSDRRMFGFWMSCAGFVPAVRSVYWLCKEALARSQPEAEMIRAAISESESKWVKPGLQSAAEAQAYKCLSLESLALLRGCA